MKSQQLNEQKKLKKFIERRHPLYEAMAAHWAFLEQTYTGGRAWFNANVHRYIKEGDREYEDRLARAYRFNHTHEVVDLVDKYLFKMEIARNEELPESVKEFWERSTLQGQSIREFMKSVSTWSSVYGRIWVVVDSNKTEDVKSVADEKEAGVGCYAYIVNPLNVLDMSYDDESGKLNWILIHETVRDDADPMESSGKLQSRFRLWTREYVQTFLLKQNGNRTIVVPSEQIPNELGEVPIIAADSVICDEKYTSPAMIADVAYLDRAVANYLSNLDAIIQDQTFSQLAMPASGISPGEETYDKLLEMGTKRIFVYDGGEGGSQPFYLSPDVKQAELILKVINKIINEIYHSVGLAGERTKEDNSQGIDNSSGVAKAYDFERVNSLLAAKADSLQSVENKIVCLVAKYNGEESAIEALEKPAVMYPDNFDVRGLYDEFEIAARLALIEAPDEVRREQMESVIDKLFPQLKKDLRDRMIAALKTWPPQLLDAAGNPNSGPSVISKTGSNALANKLVKGSNAQV